MRLFLTKVLKFHINHDFCKSYVSSLLAKASLQYHSQWCLRCDVRDAILTSSCLQKACMFYRERYWKKKILVSRVIKRIIYLYILYRVVHRNVIDNKGIYYLNSNFSGPPCLCVCVVVTNILWFYALHLVIVLFIFNSLQVQYFCFPNQAHTKVF